MRRVGLWVMLVCFALPLRAQEEAREFNLMAESTLVEVGLMAYLLPRFMLKTGRRAVLVDAGADLRLGLGGAGVPVILRAGQAWHLEVLSDNAAAQRFADWVLSKIGQRAIAEFAPGDGPGFEAAPQVVAVEAITFDGDAILGAEIAGLHCARCHRTAPERRGGIGSTPSFMALRALPDWAVRFNIFYVLNPHPAFLRVQDLSPPFDPARPPTIAPVLLTLEEVEALQAYAAGLVPANLGAPVEAK
jgi:hypothetical protein